MLVVAFTILFIVLFSGKSTGYFLPIIKLDGGGDYIPGIMIVNISEDTWIGNGLLPGGCQWPGSTCSNGEKYCEANCTFSHGGCLNVGEDKIWVGKGGGSGDS